MILLDTQILIWFAQGDEQLKPKARSRIGEAAAAGRMVISPISFWETAMLVDKRRIDLDRPVDVWTAEVCDADQVILAALTPEIAVDAGSLPGEIHGDPADRLLIATARHLACPLLTTDRKILDYADAGHVQAIDARR